MQEVDQQTFDVRPVVVLVSHDHDVAVPERLDAVVRGAVPQAQDLLDVRNLRVVHDLVVRRVSDVEKLAAKRKHAVAVSSNNRQTGNSQRLRGVPFCQNERAVLRVTPPRVVRVVQLWNPREPRLLGAVLFLQLFGLLEARPG